MVEGYKPQDFSFLTAVRISTTSENITPEDIDDSIEWVGYAVNDLDNAITVIDRNDPMTFFHIALKLEKILKES